MSVLSNLREKGLVSDEKLKLVGDIHEESELLRALAERALVNSDALIKARSEVTGLPIGSIPVSFQVSRDILAAFPGDAMKRYNVVPIEKKEDGSILVGIVEPENVDVGRALDFIEVSHGLRFEKVIISDADFQRALQKIVDLEFQVKAVLQRLSEEETKEVVQGKPGEKEETLERLVQQAPVAQIVDVVLRYGVEGGASDIHIEPTLTQLRVRYRLDGKLKPSLLLPKELISPVVTRIKILAHLRVDESRIPQGGRIHQLFDSHFIDFRVSTLPTVEGEKIVIRILDPSKGIVSLEQLGLQHKALGDVQKFMTLPYGALLISGPTGSGKSTTLYSVLKGLNQEQVNIVTLEDPVEYVLSGVNQSQVRPEIKYTFASGLREVLRQDPNIIMVGEVRDRETAELLIHSSLTGHLVLSTIHTNDAIGILPRLLDMGIDSFLIPSALRLALAQRLLPKLCQDCKDYCQVPLPMQKTVEKELALLPRAMRETINLKNLKFFKTVGCATCGKTGAKGRVGIFETLVVDEDITRIISEKPSESQFRAIARKQGMISMRQDGILKAIQGILSMESVFAETVSSSSSSMDSSIGKEPNVEQAEEKE